MFKLELNTENAAFQDDNLKYELSRIVTAVLRSIEAGAKGGICYDSNGNAVGNWSIDG